MIYLRQLNIDLPRLSPPFGVLTGEYSRAMYKDEVAVDTGVPFETFDFE